MKAKELFNYIKVKNIKGALPDLHINKITQDTRELEVGDVFLCIEGSDFDGHLYAKDAVEKGAVVVVAQKELTDDLGDTPIVYVNDTRKMMAILASAFYKHPSEELTVIGVTGTNGKTTVTYLIDAICKAVHKKTGLVGTIEMHIDDEVLPTINTTPDNVTMQRSMRRMVEKGVEVCSMEVSSHSLVQGRTWGIDMDVAVITNLTHEHLDFHKTMEEYSLAKELLFTQLGNNWKNGKGKIAVLNKDDQTFERYSCVTPAEVISYSIKDASADFFADQITFNQNGTHFNLAVAEKNYPVEIKLIGEYNVSNALAALAAAYASGISLEDASKEIGELQLVEGRLEPVSNTDGYSVYIDYAHSPDGLEKVLDALQPITSGRVINVMGCQGSRDKEKRPVMGRIASDHADYVVYTTDSPEMEPQEEIIKMVLSDVRKDNYTYIEDRREAIFHAVQIAEPGDSVVITGRGHETFYNVGKKPVMFLDREVAEEAVEYRNTLKQKTD